MDETEFCSRLDNDRVHFIIQDVLGDNLKRNSSSMEAGRHVLLYAVRPGFGLDAVCPDIRRRLDEIEWIYVTIPSGVECLVESGIGFERCPGFAVAPMIRRRVDATFHATRRSLIPRIMNEGLLPSNPERATTHFPDTEGAIHVTANLESNDDDGDGARYWMSLLSKRNRFDDTDWTILQIDMQGIPNARVYEEGTSLPSCADAEPCQFSACRIRTPSSSDGPQMPEAVVKNPTRTTFDTMRIILTTFGSLGDLHPYLAIAHALKDRGHQPVIATSLFYKDKVEKAGIEFHAVRPDFPDAKTAAALMDRVMDHKKGSEVVIRELVMPHLRDSYDDLLEAVRGADLLVSHVITYTARLVAEKTGIPWASTILAPFCFLSAYDPPVLPPAAWLAKLRFLGPWFHRPLLGFLKWCDSFLERAMASSACRPGPAANERESDV